MLCSRRSLGQIPCNALRRVWDQSHACLSGRYGTSPIGHYFSTLGLHRTLMKAFKYGVPCCVFRDLWDRFHSCISGGYWTGPLLWPMRPIYRVVRFSGTYGTPFWKLWHEFPCLADIALIHLWDWVHIKFWRIYGTGPMYSSEVPMGPVPYLTWDFKI